MSRILLGVNVDHVATVRQQRRGSEPDPLAFACAAEKAGADSIVCHLREDRRHIQDDDLRRLRKGIRTRLNLEMGLSDGIVKTALDVRPDRVTLVPEQREELTTEGGLDVLREGSRIRSAVKRFHGRGIEVSLFVDPDVRQIRAARATGASWIEIHTGAWANRPVGGELARIRSAARVGKGDGLRIAAGHGLDLRNAARVARIEEIEELNIGYSIVVHALSVGWKNAVRALRSRLDQARS